MWREDWVSRIVGTGVTESYTDLESRDQVLKVSIPAIELRPRRWKSRSKVEGFMIHTQREL